jgi:hypothetical protein
LTRHPKSLIAATVAGALEKTGGSIAGTPPLGPSV